MKQHPSKKSRVTKAKQDIFVSVVVVARPDFVELDGYTVRLSEILAKAYTNYEIIIVDNGLPIESVKEAVALLDKLPCIRVVRLSRKYTHDTAIMAGVEGAIGDYTVVTDPALDPIEEITSIVEQNASVDIVQGVASVSERRMLDTNIGRKLFYWYNRKHLLIDVSPRSTYFIALSRRAVRAITSSVRHDGHIRHLIKTIGYSYAEYDYKTLEDPTRSRSLKTGVLEALDIVSSHSTHPLRFMSWLGLMASVVNVVYALYVVTVAIVRQDVAEGWTTMSLQLSVMFFVMFLFMLVLSEYIGKILNEARRDSRYNVMDELSSTVSLADLNRKNVSKE